jgi:hypothetical protein
VADIFISYAKADRDLADKLATMLEAEGWTVWWDKSLAAGETYRDEIMKQLAAARAVIAIWTSTSVKSDWVRAEAGRAKADGKLIPVKAPDLTYPDIPLPFGEMHTENVGSHDLIKAAVVAQLAKPQVEPSALRMATKTVRFQLLTWVGIVGGAVTIFSNLRGLLSLANWARWLVTHWQDLIQGFWTALFGWMGLRIPPLLIPMLSFAVFVAMIIVGAALRTAGTDRSGAKNAGPEIRTRRLRRFLAWSVGYAVFVSVLYLGLVSALRYELIGDSVANALPAFGVLAPMIALVLVSNEKLQSALMIVIVFVLVGLTVVFPTMDLMLDAAPADGPAGVCGLHVVSVFCCDDGAGRRSAALRDRDRNPGTCPARQPTPAVPVLGRGRADRTQRHFPPRSASVP